MDYLKRYRNGEYEQVWDELKALGPAVRQEQYYSQACAVAAETMRRVRGNCELIVARLQSLGYVFGTYPDGTDYYTEGPLVTPSNAMRAAITQLEAEAGPLPISLVAFWQEVGSVDLVGMHPEWPNGLDPLVVWPPDAALSCLYDSDDSTDENLADYEWFAPLAPDDVHKDNESGSDPIRGINVPFWQNPWPQTSMVVRTEGDPRGVITSVASAINAVDPDLPLAGVRTVDEIVDESLAIDRFTMVLFSSFELLGLALAGVGIYGVMAFGVAQRTQEFGIRMALGAQRSQVIRLVLREGTIVAVVGAFIGLGGAYLVGRAMQSTLYGVGAMDGFAIGGTAVLLLLVALLACFVPALRASRVQPMVALRDQ